MREHGLEERYRQRLHSKDSRYKEREKDNTRIERAREESHGNKLREKERSVERKREYESGKLGERSHSDPNFERYRSNRENEYYREKEGSKWLKLEEKSPGSFRSKHSKDRNIDRDTEAPRLCINEELGDPGVPELEPGEILHHETFSKSEEITLRSSESSSKASTSVFSTSHVNSSKPSEISRKRKFSPIRWEPDTQTGGSKLSVFSKNRKLPVETIPSTRRKSDALTSSLSPSPLPQQQQEQPQAQEHQQEQPQEQQQEQPEEQQQQQKEQEPQQQEQQQQQKEGFKKDENAPSIERNAFQSKHSQNNSSPTPSPPPSHFSIPSGKLELETRMATFNQDSPEVNEERDEEGSTDAPMAEQGSPVPDDLSEEIIPDEQKESTMMEIEMGEEIEKDKKEKEIKKPKDKTEENGDEDGEDEEEEEGEDRYFEPSHHQHVMISSSRWAEEIFSPENLSQDNDKSAHKRQKTQTSEKSKTEGLEKKTAVSSPKGPEHVKKEKEAGVRKKAGGQETVDGEAQKEVGDGGGVGAEDEDYEKELNRRELQALEDGEDEEEEAEFQRPESSSEDEEEGDYRGGRKPSCLSSHLRVIDMRIGCRSVDEYERLNRIDEGTYGVVYRARDKRTGEIVALKKVKMDKEREGFPLTSLREINILLSLHHPSIVDVKEVVVGNNLDSIFMVMEYMDHDLKSLMETMKQPFSQSEVKCLMLQLLNGINYLHQNWVLHRDLKTSNLLLNNRGELKICDLGLSRQYGSPLKAYTHLVVTLWYRAPELLLGAKKYSTAIDMWSLGCIMAELLSKEPLFAGKSEIDQLDKIFKLLGTPNEKIWPDYSNLPNVKKINFVRQPYLLLGKKFPPTSFDGKPTLSSSGFDLLNKLLTYDPKKRITAEEALSHEWFKEVPLPKSQELMPTFPARNEHDRCRRMRRLQKSPDPLEELKRKTNDNIIGGGGLFG